ncbi:dephospho-CoA kinase [Secundilactobacillus malefermentans]|uniref:Dephospho-CoA kinase n=1 Tax=Secundilactobacillus malefermentans TaxID=176292 RepID=A0A4R5NPA8_9LACO|nr:dephospho-CoA kinase [Secundilactobacillus malefermentans]KRM57411.1 dephospho-CoA kinase [Secundilactobacillus malefermentans DSM 5705 = KCTC 3548]QEA30734.1 dephospho-CoA kinase [Secundilactobacillus malefermentans]TDG78444.1 hypothetical protein C5L31_000387 [Secundilactobacillus malefermentans]
MKVIGLTGGIATGKSTVSKIIREQGISVVDADEIARQLVAPESEALKQIISYFGTDYLSETGKLNRKKLGLLVFTNPQKLIELNNIMNPLIKEEIKRQLKTLSNQGKKVVVLDMPTLFEAHFENLVDEITVVEVPESVQLERLMRRDNSIKSDAQSRIDSQLPLKEKIAKASFVIDNSHAVAETKAQVLKWLASEELENTKNK